MEKKFTTTRRNFLAGGAAAATAAAAAGSLGLTMPAFAQDLDLVRGPKRKLVWIPQVAGEWDINVRVGALDASELLGWEFQRIGNPVYSVRNHVEQVDNAIASKPDVIATSLESVGLVPAFKRAMAQGITMVITDQVIDEEADKLGLNRVGQNETESGILNGLQAAKFAQKLTGKKEGVVILGNGAPGVPSIDKRQWGGEIGVKRYNEENGTKFEYEAFNDSEFGELTESIQKWSAQIDRLGDRLVAAIGSGNPIPIVQAFKERGFAPEQVAIGSTDAQPAHLKLIAENWVQWGIDNHFYFYGVQTVIGAWVQFQTGTRYMNANPGLELVNKENIPELAARTKTLLEKARGWGLV